MGSDRRHGRGRLVLRGAACVAVFGLIAALPATAVSATTTPSAGQVAAARQRAHDVAAQVGVMQAMLAAAEARMVALGQAVDAASETYDGAMYRLAQAQQSGAAAQQAAAGAQVQVDAARLDLGRLAAAAYRGDGLGLGLGAVMSANSPDAMLEAVSTMGVLAKRQDAVVQRVQATRVVASVMNQQASQALAAVAQAAAAAAEARSAVQAKVAAQTAQVAQLNAQVTILTQALAVARARSSQLSLARSAGLARAAEQARAAAARARAGRHHSSGGGGGVDSSGHPGTPQGSLAGAAAAIAYARAQLGKPYQWAGAGPDTFDCSGLTMMAWAAGGVQLAHWTVAQWQESTPVSAADARPGDLVFYAYDLHDYTTIHHVALYIGGGQIIEAPFTGADVRISTANRPDLFGYGRP